MKLTIITMGLAAIVALVPSGGALADRAPTAEERNRIEQVLTGAGFSRWDEIEFDDDGVWEVDDAVAPDGLKYDVRLDRRFAVIDRRPD